MENVEQTVLMLLKIQSAGTNVQFRMKEMFNF